MKLVDRVLAETRLTKDEITSNYCTLEHSKFIQAFCGGDGKNCDCERCWEQEERSNPANDEPTSQTST